MIKKTFVCDLCDKEIPQDAGKALRYYRLKISHCAMTTNRDMETDGEEYRDICQDCKDNLGLEK